MKKLIGGLLLSFLLAVPALAAVNLNTATQAELEAVKGVGPAKAKAILAYRVKHGAFRSVGDLDKVKGFGPASVGKLKKQFIVAPAGAGHTGAK